MIHRYYIENKIDAWSLHSHRNNTIGNYAMFDAVIIRYRSRQIEMYAAMQFTKLSFAHEPG